MLKLCLVIQILALFAWLFTATVTTGSLFALSCAVAAMHVMGTWYYGKQVYNEHQTLKA
jgi:hypothetical protein